MHSQSGRSRQPALSTLGMRRLRKASYFPQVLEELKQERVKLEADRESEVVSGSFRLMANSWLGRVSRSWIAFAPLVATPFATVSARQLPASRSAWRKPLSR